jgi:cytidylate kinase
MIIAIDGPAGSGKSTIAKMLAENLKGSDSRDYTYINSGYLYRAVTLGCLRAGIDLCNSDKVMEFAKNLNITYQKDQVFINGENVTKLLHSDEIDRHSAPLSAFVPVRHFINSIIRSLSDGINVVVEGRDMTTVVFPDARFRFYLDASTDSRAKRRFDQGVSDLDINEIKNAILRRDDIDKNKIEGSLKIAPNVNYLDTSDLTINQVYDILVDTIEKEK